MVQYASCASTDFVTCASIVVDHIIADITSCHICQFQSQGEGAWEPKKREKGGKSGKGVSQRRTAASAGGGHESDEGSDSDSGSELGDSQDGVPEEVTPAKRGAPAAAAAAATAASSKGDPKPPVRRNAKAQTSTARGSPAGQASRGGAAAKPVPAAAPVTKSPAAAVKTSASAASGRGAASGKGAQPETKDLRKPPVKPTKVRV